MPPRPTRLREAVRRLAVGMVLLLGAGVAVNEDLSGLPDTRRGTRRLELELPHVGAAIVHTPVSGASGVALILHRGGSPREREALEQAVPWHALLVDVDVSRLPPTSSCAAIADQIEDISRRAQREAGLTTYLRPVLVVTPSALPVAAAAIEGSTPAALPAAVALGFPERGFPPRACSGARPAAVAEAGHTGRWFTPPHAGAIAPLVEHALASASATPHRDGTAVERWLRHFDLPLTAAWSSSPRAMLVLLSPARGWRADDDALARHLAGSGVHVVGIDALQSFWQRRSPREVAHELQRLTDALASTGLPVYIGGREFGAETMAVAGEMMASTRHVAGVVLVDPGPTAFFEVEPPALALRPLGPRDWSTRAAVVRLERPTLCVTHAAQSSSDLLCASLARRGQATLATTHEHASALADTIARFVLQGGS